MNKNIGLIWLLLFLILLSHGSYLAQGGFKKKYYLQNSSNSICSEAIEAPDGNLLTLGIISTSSNNLTYNQLTLLCTDNQGNVIWRKDYGTAKFQYSYNSLVTRGAIVKSDDGFYTALVAKDSNNIYLSTLIKFNYNGDSLWQKRFYTNVSGENLYAQTLCKTMDGALLMSGIIESFNTNLTKIFFLKTDLNGGEFWRQQVISANAINPVWAANRSVQDAASKKIITAGYQYIGSNIYSLILVTDSLGVKIWSTNFAGNYGGVMMDLIQCEDNNYLAVGSKRHPEFIGSWEAEALFAVKFDINGGILWSKEFESPSIANYMATVNELPGGDLVFGGNVDTNSLNSMPLACFSQIIKTNSGGDVIWKKKIKNSLATSAGSEQIRSVNPTSDGGFIISTWLPYASSPRPYRLVKIDATGCDTSEAYCQSLNVGISESGFLNNELFKIGPNPTYGDLTLIYEGENNIPVLVELKDLLGGVIYSNLIQADNEQQISLQNSNAGIYILTVTRDKELLYKSKIVKQK